MTVTPVSPPIKAIETEYAGCRFRSRLEARWAVFFDTLGLKWRYEPQGYELPSGRYLPDFMLAAFELGLPDREIYVEVKGALSPDEACRLIQAAMELPPVTAGQWRPTLLVLGDIPRPGTTWAHSRIEVGDDMWAIRSTFFTNSFMTPLGEAVPFRGSALSKISPTDSDFLAKWLTESVKASRVVVDSRVDAAYRAARSARFEFGETPALPQDGLILSPKAMETQARIARAASRRKRPSLGDRIAASADSSDLDTAGGRAAFLQTWVKEVGKLPYRSREKYVAQLVEITGSDYREIERAIDRLTGF